MKNKNKQNEKKKRDEPKSASSVVGDVRTIRDSGEEQRLERDQPGNVQTGLLDRVRGAERAVERVRGHVAVAQRRHGLVEQRQHVVARLPLAQHALVLRPRRVRGRRHETHAQRRQDQVQADPHRQAAQLFDHRHRHLLVDHVRHMHDRLRHMGVVPRLRLSDLLAVGGVRLARSQSRRHCHLASRLLVLSHHSQHRCAHLLVRQCRVHPVRNTYITTLSLLKKLKFHFIKTVINDTF